MALKSILHHIFPLSRGAFRNYVIKNDQKLASLINYSKESAEILSSIKLSQSEIKSQLQEQQKAIQLLGENMVRLYDRYCVETSHAIADMGQITQQPKTQTTELQQVLLESQQVTDKICDISQDISHDLKELWTFIRSTRRQLDYHQSIIREIEWAQIFRDTISGCPWLKDPSFSLGRWAAGYPLMYVLYQVLKQKRPISILELGMGQSTKMITQYVDAHADTKHVVIEHDPAWIDFSQKSFKISERSKMMKLDLAESELEDGSRIKIYDRFKEAVSQDKYDLIVIDAPFGGDTQSRSRIDILGVLPHCLLPSFVVILDDFNRPGEKNTGEAICDILSKQGIPFNSGKYSGKKETFVITSVDNAFLCTQ